MIDWRKGLLFFCFVAMMGSLFLSRALLSISMGLFVVLSFWHKDAGKQLKTFLSVPLLWSMSLLFFLPLVSGLWTEDKQEWLSVLRLKLPLLVLPMAFAGPVRFSSRQWDRLAYIFIAFTTAGSIWSLFLYAGNMENINESYLKAKSIATLLGNDHVRYSWVVSIVILLTAWMSWKKRQHKVTSILLLLVMCWLIIFLHLLAARTGLFSFYIMLLVTGCWLLIKKTRKWQGAALLVSVLALPFLAWLLFPSFQNRLKYISYDYSYFKDLKYLPGGNDVARVISIRAGWNLLKEHPVTGVGAGDIYNKTREWDRAKYPEILDADMLYPSSEWLIYGLICGWTGVLVFTIVILIPFFNKRRPWLVWILLNLTAAFSFLFDMGLEVQYGVFVYAFIVLWWWKWFKEAAVANQ